MQIVIELSNDTYNRLLPSDCTDGYIRADVVVDAIRAVRSGTPLPKGHGRLIDADNLSKDEYLERRYGTDFYWEFRRRVDKQSTIIEADKAESEEVFMKSNDLIYRSDALDLFGHGSSYTSEDAQRMIRNLPSADGSEEKKNDSMTIDEVIELLTETKELRFSENYGLSKEWYLRYEKCTEKSIRSLKAWKEILYTIDRYIHLHSGYQTKQEEYGKHDGAKYCADVIREYLKEVKE